MAKMSSPLAHHRPNRTHFSRLTTLVLKVEYDCANIFCSKDKKAKTYLPADDHAVGMVKFATEGQLGSVQALID